MEESDEKDAEEEREGAEKEECRGSFAESASNASCRAQMVEQ